MNRENSSQYQQIIQEYFPYIEKQCVKAVQLKWPKNKLASNRVDLENEALELNNLVLEKMSENDFQVLKRFKGRAKLSTYLSTVIANLAVDLVRKKWGRSREKERAKKLGPIGEKIYEMVYTQGIPANEVFNQLPKDKTFSHSEQEVVTIINTIKGKKRTASTNGSGVYNGFLQSDTGNPVVADKKNNPENRAIKNHSRAKFEQVIAQVLAQLNGEERLILKMKFPLDINKSPLKVDQIAILLKLNKKTVYKKISAILKKCRENMLALGVNPNEWF